MLVAILLPAYLWRSELSRLGRELVEPFLHHPFFSVREIKVRGGERVGGNEIVGLAGLSHGARIWEIEPLAIENKVGQHPWVKRVVVRREFPHRVVIDVEERSAKAILTLGRLFYVDGDGYVFEEVGESGPLDLLVLSGLRRDELAAEPQSTRLKLREAVRLGELAERASLSLSEVHFLSEGGVVLYPMNFSMALYMGWGQWEEKFRRLAQVLALWRGRESRLAALNLTFTDQVVARLRNVQ